MSPEDVPTNSDTNRDGTVRRKQEEMVRRARARGLGVMASTFDSDPEDLARQVASWRELGVRLSAVSNDRFMLSSGYNAIVSRLHHRQAVPA